MDQLIRQRLHPAKQGNGLDTSILGRRPCQFNQARRAGEILGGQSVADGIGSQTVLLEPRTRPFMQGS